MDLEYHKKVWGVWVYIPCISGVGSCPISDLCSVLPQTSDCPLHQWYHCVLGLFIHVHIRVRLTKSTIRGIPCDCPLPEGGYVLPPPGFSIHLGDPKVSWLTNVRAPLRFVFNLFYALYTHEIVVFFHVQGDFKLKATLKNPKGVRMGCLEIGLTITT